MQRSYNVANCLQNPNNRHFIGRSWGQDMGVSDVLTHWGRVTHICVGKLTIIGSDNGLSPGRRQAIFRTNDEILLIRPRGTNFSEISIGNQTFSFRKMRFKMSSAKWRTFSLGLNVLKPWSLFCFSHCNALCNIVWYWTALGRHSTAIKCHSSTLITIALITTLKVILLLPQTNSIVCK